MKLMLRDVRKMWDDYYRVACGPEEDKHLQKSYFELAKSAERAYHKQLRNAACKDAKSENIKLRAAIEAVEWIDVPVDYGFERERKCAWNCGGTESTGHAPRCQRQLAREGGGDG